MNAPGSYKWWYLDALPSEWRLFFEFLAHSGLRIGEAVALTWADVELGKKRVHVRRRLYRGRFDLPKSRYSLRSVPLSAGIAQQLWRLRASASDEAPVLLVRRKRSRIFPSEKTPP